MINFVQRPGHTPFIAPNRPVDIYPATVLSEVQTGIRVAETHGRQILLYFQSEAGTGGVSV